MVGAGTIAYRSSSSARLVARVTPALPTSVSYDGRPAVGALFGSATATVHDCTATVVDSPAGDLLVTAAHCVRGSGRGYVFVPGYYDGDRPFGSWTVTGAFAATGWIDGQNQADDVAFLEVAPQDRDGRLQSIQAVTGGHRLASAPASGRIVTVPAYAAGANDKPFVCSARAFYDGPFPAFDCNAYPDGTSGAPFLLNAAGGRTIGGVIGGLHQGGCNVVTSYTSAFGAQVQETYQRAIHNQSPDILPVPGGDGC